MADIHFGHTVAVRTQDRPFADTDEMDRAVIANWNARVRPDDDVWMAGDVTYRAGRPVADYISQLSGRKHLVVGNHDAKWMKRESDALAMYEGVEQIAWVSDGEWRVVVCHYPMMEWAGFWRGSWHVYGHIHSNRPGAYFDLLRTESYARALNAGVDVNGFIRL